MGEDSDRSTMYTGDLYKCSMHSLLPFFGIRKECIFICLLCNLILERQEFQCPVYICLGVYLFKPYLLDC